MADQTAVPQVKDVDPDVDAEMENTQDTTTASRNPNENSSATLDHEFTQSEPQPAAPGSSLPHHDRKDVTLREFLSKMDDYAPIVSSAMLTPSTSMEDSQRRPSVATCMN